MNAPANITSATLRVINAAKGLDGIDVDLLNQRIERSMIENMSEEDIVSVIVMEARPLIETNPVYSTFAANVMNQWVEKKAAGHVDALLSINEVIGFEHSSLFIQGLAIGVKLELYNCNPFLIFDMDMLDHAITTARTNYAINDFIGFQTLYDRYFLRYRDYLIEDYFTFYMRVAMGQAMNESNNPTQRAIEFFQTYMRKDYSSSTPTLFNSMLKNSQMSSCYLTTIPDALAGIYDGIKDNALLSKFAGGLGNDWTPVRSLGAWIKSTNGKSQGVIPFLKVANDTAVAVNQGGKRKGAVCAFLETWHLDIEEFLELRKNTGDDRRRTHDMNTANWVPDLFMERVFNKEPIWTLFSPNDVPDLHDLYGIAFKERYEHYEAMVAAGTYQGPYRQVKPLELWRKMLGMVFETGHPWITFKDPCNIRSPQQHAGVVHSSNLCTEIVLNTKAADEIAVCNLGSVNIANHVAKGMPHGIDGVKLRNTVRTAVRMLDNVIDVNFYPVPTARNANIRHRPIGLGVMGYQDALYILGFPYDSEEAVMFSDLFMEQFSYYAIEASADLAREKGSYSSFEGSLWSQGILPIDSIKMLKESRSLPCTMDEGKYSIGVSGLDWDALRDKVRQGMRNSNTMAIAPTATIANIFGVTQSIEPTYQNLYVKSNLSGEFTVINVHMYHALNEAGLWDQEMVDYLKVNEGSLQDHPRVPQYIKDIYRTAFEVDPFQSIEAASRRQKWIDQAQSLNLYVKGANGKLLDQVYNKAWSSGLKTTYYLRALAATTTEKSTVTSSTLNKVSA